MFFLNRGSKRQIIKKVPVYHEKTLKKINKYKKKNLEKLKPQKKSAFLWEKNSYCYVYSFLELKCAAHSPIHPSIHPSPSPPKPMTETVVGQLAHSCMRQRRPPPTSCLTCGKGGRKTSSKRSFGCNMHSKYPNTQTVQIHHLLDQFQWILTPGIVYLYCISLGGRSGVHVPNPLLKKPLCKGPGVAIWTRFKSDQK